jgi:hypothetical protein
MSSAVVPVFIGVACGVLACVGVVVLAVLLPNRHCPECNAVIPKWPKEMKEKGWRLKNYRWSSTVICPHCGCESRAGKKVDWNTSEAKASAEESKEKKGLNKKP